MKTMIRNHNIIEVFIIVVMLIAVNLLGTVFQEQITHLDGKGIDGAHYYEMAAQLAEGDIPEEKAPFVTRIGTSLLVALLFDDDLMLGFKVVNIIAAVLATALLYVWFRLFIGSWRIRLLLVLMFITQWHAPVRNIHFFPVYTDPWLFVCGSLQTLRRFTPRAEEMGVLSPGIEMDHNDAQHRPRRDALCGDRLLEGHRPEPRGVGDLGVQYRRGFHGMSERIQPLHRQRRVAVRGYHQRQDILYNA